MRKFAQIMKKIFVFIHKKRFTHFSFVGTTGVILNLFVTFLLVEFILTQPTYNFGIILKNTTLGVVGGHIMGLLYVFTFHTIWVFKTKQKHFQRLFVFMTYSSFMAFAVLTPLTSIMSILFENFSKFALPNLLGFEYLLASTLVIGFFSIFNFVFLRGIVFNEQV